MLNILEGLYHDGIIELKNKYPLKENCNIKLIMVEDSYQINTVTEDPKNDRIDFGIYKLGNSLDKVNIRDYAHEN